MATATTTPDQAMVVILGKLHADYTIILQQPVNEVYPYLIVTNGKVEVGIQIRLSRNYWDVVVLDRLVNKAIKSIETAPHIEKGKK